MTTVKMPDHEPTTSGHAPRFLADATIAALVTWQNDFGYDDDDLDRVGKTILPTRHYFMSPAVAREAPVLVFRLRDEDGEVHYLGLLRDDEWSEVQSALSTWGAYDTGGFIIEVRGTDPSDEWEMIVG